jgi:hypothetical protein
MNEIDNGTSPLDRRNAALRAALRAGDPAGDPAALDVDRLRRRVRAAREAGAQRRAWRLWIPVAAVAASLAVLWIVAAPSRQSAQHVEPTRAGAAAAPTETVASAGEVRQMQFETPGGTRIIWVMPAHLD